MTDTTKTIPWPRGCPVPYPDADEEAYIGECVADVRGQRSISELHAHQLCDLAWRIFKKAENHELERLREAAGVKALPKDALKTWTRVTAVDPSFKSWNNRIKGYGMVWDGRLTKDTDLWLDRDRRLPLTMLDYGKVGEVVTREKDDGGVWIETQLDRHNRYLEMLADKIEKGELYMEGNVPWVTKKSAPLLGVSLVDEPKAPYRVLTEDDLWRLPEAAKRLLGHGR